MDGRSEIAIWTNLCLRCGAVPIISRSGQAPKQTRPLQAWVHKRREYAFFCSRTGGTLPVHKAGGAGSPRELSHELAGEDSQPKLRSLGLHYGKGNGASVARP